MEFTGVITKRIDKSGVSKKGDPFVAYQYRIEEPSGQFPQSLLGETFGDKVVVMNEGDHVTVQYNVRCDEYEGRLYGKNNIWKADVSHSTGVGNNDSPKFAGEVASADGSSDDLPF